MITKTGICVAEPLYSDDIVDIVTVDDSLYYMKRENPIWNKWEDLFKSYPPPKFNGWYCSHCMQDVIVDKCPTCNCTKDNYCDSYKENYGL